MMHRTLRTIHTVRPIKGITWESLPSSQPVKVVDPIPEEASPEIVEPVGPTPEALCLDALDQICDQLRAIDAARSQNMAELQQVAVELAVAVASHIVKQQLDAGTLSVASLVTEGVARLLPASPIQIRLHPLDLDGLRQIDAERFAQVSSQATFETDPGVPRGGCHVLSGDHGLWSTLEERFQAIRETLLQGIEYAQTDRRQAQGTAAELRRFPERRQTA